VHGHSNTLYYFIFVQCTYFFLHESKQGVWDLHTCLEVHTLRSSFTVLVVLTTQVHGYSAWLQTN